VLFEDRVEHGQQIEVKVPHLHGIHIGTEQTSGRLRVLTRTIRSVFRVKSACLSDARLGRTKLSEGPWRTICPGRSAERPALTLERKKYGSTAIVGDSLCW